MMDIVDSPPLAGTVKRQATVELCSDLSGSDEADEGSDQEDVLEHLIADVEDGKGRAPFCGCYLLRSSLKEHPRSTYIGFTVNPLRRIRQHNGQIQGGARKTKSKRPWCFVALVNGFHSQVEALKFEWAWQHPKKSVALREILDEPLTKMRAGWKGQLDILTMMLTVEKWRHLEVRVSDPEATPIPPHLMTFSTLTIGPISAWEPACKAAESGVVPIVKRVATKKKSDQASHCCENATDAKVNNKKRKKDLFRDPMACALCGNEGGDFHICRHCKAEAHVSCLGNAFAAAAARGGRTQGACPLCSKHIQLRGNKIHPTLAPTPQQALSLVPVLDLSGNTPVAGGPTSPSDATLDLCSPSPVSLSASMTVGRDFQQATTTPLADRAFDANVSDCDDDEDETESIIDLTRSVRKSCGLSFCSSSRNRHQHRPRYSMGSLATPTMSLQRHRAQLFSGQDDDDILEKSSDSDNLI